jgi:glycosyltransferase involved in cell wall biosynthesis
VWNRRQRWRGKGLDVRIACISTSKVPGITANALQLMKACEALVGLGHEVNLWIPDFGGRLAWEQLSEIYGLRLRFPIVRLAVIRPLRRYDFCWRAVRAAEQRRSDLLYVWPLQGAALGAARGVPTLLEMHDRPRGLMGPWLFRRFLKGAGARRLLVTTKALEATLAESYGMAPIQRLSVHAPNGVDLERYQGLPAAVEARRRLDWPDKFTAVYTGHLYPGRGANLMFELALRNPAIEFVWAGGTEKAVREWRGRVSEEGLGNLQVLGFVPNARLPELHAAADVLLMPYGERVHVSGGLEVADFASPMKAFEYMAAGRPILSSDLPAIREILDEGTAVLLPPNAVDDWDRALRDLRSDPERRRQLGLRARERAKEHTWIGRAERALQGLAEREGG